MYRQIFLFRCLLMMVLLAVTVAVAQEKQRFIDEIDIRTVGENRVSREFVLGRMRSVPGSVFEPQVLSEDVERLYRTDKYQDIAVQVEDAGDGKLKVVLTILAKPLINDVRFQGNSIIKTSRLSSLITHRSGQPLNERTLAEDAGKIRELYSKKGFFRSEVKTELLKSGDTSVDIVFDIVEGERYKIQSIKFLGNMVFTDKVLKNTVRTKKVLFPGLFDRGYLDEETLHIDRAALQDLYKSKGYLDFEIEEIRKEVSPDGKSVSIIFVLNEGMVYTVRSITVAGNKHFSDSELMSGLKLKTGKDFSSTDEWRDVRAIVNRYQSVGYLDVRVYAERRPDAADLTVGVGFQVAEGAPSEIRDIYISGNKVTQDRVLRRELAIHPGDLGDMSKIETSRAKLMNLNYFESVSITPVATEQEGKKDLHIDVKEKRTGQLMLGAGFSSEENFVAMFEVAQSNFDWQNWPHFTGAGQRLRLRMNLGTERNEFSLSFSEPWLMGKKLQMDLELFSNSRENDEYTEERLGAGVLFTRAWRSHWRQSYGFRFEQIDLTDFDSGLSAELLAEEGDYTNNTLTYRLTRDTRDRFVNPTRGSRLVLSTDLLSELWGSYSNVYRLNLSGTKYFPVLEQCVLKMAGEIGLVDNFSGDDVAIFNRFFTGGAYSIRGFKRREVGPVDVNEDPVGGQSLLQGSVEFTFPIFRKVRGSFFCDFGNAWRDAAEWNPAEMNISVGAGVQFDLPIGPIRFDYGIPVVTDQDHLDGGGRLHFNLGYFF